jgi:hypothetical protein
MPMARRVAPVALRSVLIAALALVAAGCGKSKERELYEQRQAACAEIQGLTVSAARAVLLNREDAVLCRDDFLRRDATDVCGGATTGPYTETVCEVLFIWVANDPGLCNNTGGCQYACGARVNLADATPVGNTVVFDDALICWREWIP